MTYKELTEKRGVLIEQMKAHVAAFGNDPATWAGEPSTKYAAMETELKELDAKRKSAYDYETAVANLNAAMETNPQGTEQALRAAHAAQMRGPDPSMVPGQSGEAAISREESAETYRAWALLGAAKQGKITLSPTHRALAEKHAIGDMEYMAAHRNWRRPRTVKEALAIQAQVESGEHRALSLTAGAGGNTVPNEAMAEIDLAMLLYGAVYRYAQVVTTETGGNLPWPTANDTANVATVLAEAGAAGVATDPTFGQTVLGAFMYHSTVVKVSVQLLQDSSVNVPQLLGQLLGIRIGRGTNVDFTTGAGTTLPFGVVTRAGNSSVVQATPNVWAFTELLALEHSVDPAYRMRPNCVWMMNDKTFLYIKQTKDSQNRPLFLPNMVEGGQAMIDGFPVVINPQMAGGNSGKSIVFGDLYEYKIREASGVQFYRLNELYMGNLQVGFFATWRGDGNLLIPGSGNEPVKYATNNATTV